jgi:hypothetical protein
MKKAQTLGADIDIDYCSVLKLMTICPHFRYDYLSLLFYTFILLGVVLVIDYLFFSVEVQLFLLFD